MLTAAYGPKIGGLWAKKGDAGCKRAAEKLCAQAKILKNINKKFLQKSLISIRLIIVYKISRVGRAGWRSDGCTRFRRQIGKVAPTNGETLGDKWGRLRRQMGSVLRHVGDKWGGWLRQMGKERGWWGENHDIFGLFSGCLSVGWGSGEGRGAFLGFFSTCWQIERCKRWATNGEDARCARFAFLATNGETLATDGEGGATNGEDGCAWARPKWSACGDAGCLAMGGPARSSNRLRLSP